MRKREKEGKYYERRWSERMRGSVSGEKRKRWKGSKREGRGEQERETKRRM